MADYSYDAFNRLSLLEHLDRDANGDGTLDDPEVRASFQYFHLLDGTRSRAIEQVDADGDGAFDAAAAMTYDWSYDSLNRLTQETLTAGDAGLNFASTYSYDLASNRTEQAKDAGSDGSVDETTTYVYDANDRLLSEAGPDDYTVYSYTGTTQTGKSVWSDDSQATKLSETTYRYDATGRLVSVEIDSDGDGTVDSTQSYSYSASGLRVSQTVDDGSTSTTTSYLFDVQNPTGHAQMLEEYVDGVLTRTYTLGHDVLAPPRDGLSRLGGA